ncbi:MAG: GNAT family N-acetyltransferase, partial [Rhizobiales bacterium]|nr:GNAT family N-acetyltransferase [Hyphomicrobiales bacterium]
MQVRIELSENPAAEDRETIVATLSAANPAEFARTEFKPFALLLRDAESGRTVGGLWGRTAFDWLAIELLVVPEPLRGQDIGTALMQRAEAAARERGCVGVRLDTYSFQAPGFYEKL